MPTIVAGEIQWQNPMLSFIYRLATRFEQRHQIRPNLLYLHPDHVSQLWESFSASANLTQILQILQMELIIDREVVHPHVGWTPALRRRAG
jgi:hypothetical protein